MHKGDFKTALETFDRQGALQWSKTPEETRAALVAEYAKDSAADPDKTRFVFAYTNAEVHELNAAIRAGRKERGELGADHSLPTREGAQDFATGDRIQFTGNAANRAQKDAGLYNGAAGRVTAIEENRLTVTLDSAKGRRRASFPSPSARTPRRASLTPSATATPERSTKGRVRPSTKPICSIPTTGAPPPAMSRFRATARASSFSPPRRPSRGLWPRAARRKLTEPQRAKAEQSFAAWTEAKPDLAKKYGFENYVSYVQAQWATRRTCTASTAWRGKWGAPRKTAPRRNSCKARALPRPTPRRSTRRPPVNRPCRSSRASSADYLELCYNPAKNWLQWIAEDLRGKAAARRADLTPTERTPHHADTHTESPRPAMENPDRIWGDALPPVQGGLDTDGGERRVPDGLPARPRAGSASYDGLRPLRDAGGRITRPAATQAEAESATARLRKQLDGAAKETTKEDEPQKASDFLKGRGRFRDRGHDR